jgi:hypothetical protein
MIQYLDKSLGAQEVISALLSLDLPLELKNLISKAFRARVKYREETNQNILQIRIFPEGVDELDLEEYRLLLQQKTKEFGIDYVVLEYKDCCMEGCSNCENFESITNS